MAQSIATVLKCIASVASRPIESARDVAMTQHELTRLADQAQALRAELKGREAYRIADWVSAIEERLFSLPSGLSAAADRIGELVHMAEAGARGEALPREMRRF